MKKSLPTGLCVLIALALVAFGLLYGTYTGYTEDRREVNALLEGENGLLDVLFYRGADGLNLHVVAGRHLPAGNAQLAALETASRTLQKPDEPLSVYAQADQSLENAAKAVCGQLKQTPGFQASERDRKYLDMLTADLAALSASAAVSAYNQAAADFNTQLAAPLTGALASLMGIDACPLFEQGGAQ